MHDLIKQFKIDTSFLHNVIKQRSKTAFEILSMYKGGVFKENNIVFGEDISNYHRGAKYYIKHIEFNNNFSSIECLVFNLRIAKIKLDGTPSIKSHDTLLRLYLASVELK